MVLIFRSGIAEHVEKIIPVIRGNCPGLLTAPFMAKYNHIRDNQLVYPEIKIAEV